MTKIFVCIFIIAIIPIVAYALLADMTKKRMTALGFIVVLGTLVAFFMRLPIGQVTEIWLSRPSHAIPLGVAVIMLAVAAIVLEHVLARRRRLTLSWKKTPPKRDFSDGITGTLFSTGWKIVNRRLSTALFTISWFEKNGLRVTFIICVERLSVETVYKLLSDEKERLNKRVYVVFWRRPTDVLAAFLLEHGWNAVDVQEFNVIARSNPNEVKLTSQPTLSSTSLTNWDLLRSE